MPTPFNCPGCQVAMSIPDGANLSRLRCPKCDTNLALSRPPVLVPPPVRRPPAAQTTPAYYDPDPEPEPEREQEPVARHYHLGDDSSRYPFLRMAAVYHRFAGVMVALFGTFVGLYVIAKAADGSGVATLIGLLVIVGSVVSGGGMLAMAEAIACLLDVEGQLRTMRERR